jgi:thioester reductase-like protein
MHIFLTGATGFLGGELLVNLSKHADVKKIYCLVRAANESEATIRLRKVFDLHGDFFDDNKVIPVSGSLTDEDLAKVLVKNNVLNDVNIILHSAANTSFSRIYDAQVEQVNVRGLQSIIDWSLTLKKLHQFVYVGTATICGYDVCNRVVHEDESPDLQSKHFVKYTYTKMMGELTIRKSLPERKILIVRPSIIMGDSRPWIPRSPVILWALATINMLRLLPLYHDAAIDIVPVDYASEAIVRLIFTSRNHSVYHVSSGVHSFSLANQITQSLEGFYTDRPSFKFVEPDLLNQMKKWTKKILPSTSELNLFSEYLDYWKSIFGDNGKLRIIFAGLEPYLRFINLGQVFENSRLLNDTGMKPSEPAYEYIKKSITFLNKIDIFEGALDP